MPELAIMDHTGDTRHMWDPDDEFTVDKARQLFDEYKKKGYMAYTVEGRNGDKGTIMRSFDPEAGKMIIMRPPVAGG